MMTEQSNAEMEIVRKIVTELFKSRKASIKMVPIVLFDEPVSAT
jgi:hypothetical protein